MLRNIAGVAVCAAAFALVVSAQSPPTSDTANSCPALPKAKKMPGDDTKDANKDTLSLLQIALAKEWLNAPQNALSALQFLTVGVSKTPVADELVVVKRGLQNLIALDPAHQAVYQKALNDLPKAVPPEPAGNSSSPRETARHALQSLIDGDSDAKDQDLYRFALGDLQSEVAPNYAGISAFLDYLSEANRLNLSEPDDEGCLFASVKMLLDAIATSTNGRQNLKVVQDSFARKDKHVAIYQLLRDLPNTPADASYPQKLEALRTAYKMNSVRLAKAVAAINAPSK